MKKITAVMLAFCLLSISLTGKEINAIEADHYNFTPLIYASRNGYTEAVKALIAAVAKSFGDRNNTFLGQVLMILGLDFMWSGCIRALLFVV